MAPGETLATTVYLQATQPLTTNYGLFLHLDAPNGTTVAAVDVQHPDDIPTGNWPPGLYVRAPLRLTAPAGALPMRYDLHLGMTEPATGGWLPLDGSGAKQLKLGSVWIAPAAQPEIPATLSKWRSALGIRFSCLAAKATRPRACCVSPGVRSASDQDLTVFVHFLNAQGEVLGQADGLPFANQYAVADWRPGQVIVDERPFPAGVGQMEGWLRLPSVSMIR